MSHPFDSPATPRPQHHNITMKGLITTVVSTNKGWLIRKAMGYVAAGLAASTAWLAATAEAHGLPAVDSTAITTAASAAALYLLEAAFSWAAKQIATP